MNMKSKKILPPTYFQLALILSVLLHFLLPIYHWIDYPLTLIGILPILIGVLLNIVADRAFKNANTTVKPFEKSSFLVIDGVFRISRNPMYLGMVLIILGITIILGSVSPLIITILFAIGLQLVFIRTEEKMLEEVFGESWVNYKKKVRLWL